MLVLLSPAKKLNFEFKVPPVKPTQPRLTDDTKDLIKRAESLTSRDIKQLMKLSDDLSELNYQRFQALAKGLSDDEAKPAIMSFNGDVYQGFDVETADQASLDWAQTHLRILSGLYGALRPFDLIHPYRLEMGTRLATDRGSTLYEFWGDRISNLLNEDLKSSEGPVINLASKEYFGAVQKSALKAPVIDIHFKEEKDGKLRVLSFYAKQARGMMARWICDHRASRAEDLKNFNTGGYQYNAQASTEKELVFCRPQPNPKS